MALRKRNCTSEPLRMSERGITSFTHRKYETATALDN